MISTPGVSRRWCAVAWIASVLVAGGCKTGDGAAGDLSITDGRGPGDGAPRADRGSPDSAPVVRDLGAGADARVERIVLGALSDAHGAGDRLGQLAQDLVARGAELLVVLGDIAADRAGIASALSAVAAAGRPVYVIAGNTEPRAAYAQALADVRAKHPDVSDLAPHGSFVHGGVTFVALAGYHLDSWVVAGGFVYGAAELAAVEQQVKGATATVVLLSHGPPQSKGDQAIDHVPGAGNVGDAALRQLIDRNNVALTISGHIHEAGQRAVDERDQLIAAGRLAPRMMLNAAAVSQGRASLVELEAGQARFTSLP